MAIDKHRGKYRARWRDENGTQRAKTFDTKKEATDFVSDMRVDIRRGVRTSFDKTLRVDAVAEMWMDASVHLAPGSIRTYRRDLDRYILPNLGTIKVVELRPATIQRWIAEELTRLAPSSVHRHYRTLRTMLGWAKRQHMIPDNPCESVNPPRIPRKDFGTFTVEQIEAIAAAVNPRYRCLILVAAYGGLRWSELIGLRRLDVNAARVTVAGQLLQIDGEWKREEPKTASGRRTIVLPESVAEELAQHLVEFVGPEPHDLVFTNMHKNPIGPGFRHNVWYPACAKAGLGKRTVKNYKPAYEDMPRFHDLRHTSVALAIAAGAHPKEIQHRLGHSSIAVTMDRYGHLLPGMDEGLAADIDSLRKK